MPLPLLALLAPSIIGAAGNILGGAAKGSADERSKENLATTAANTNATNVFGTRQNALLQSLLQSGKDRMSRYEGQQGATTRAMEGKQTATTAALGNQSREGLELAKLGLEAPTVAARQSILGSLMKNMQPHQFTSPSRQIGHITDVKGGMSAANLDPMTRAQGEELLKSAMQSQLSGGNLPGRTDFMGGVQDWDKSILDVPEATDYSKGLLNAPAMAGYKKAGRGESILSGLGTGLSLAGAAGSGITGAGGGGDDGGGVILNNRLLSPQQTPWAQAAPRTALANPNVFANLADEYEY